MIAMLLPLLAQVSAAPPAPATVNREVVVTARPLSATADALARCLARSCPPDQDIDATLAHAENLFVAGEYKDARTAMLASIRRNGRHAKAHPVAVADLHRANARVAAHLGEPDAPRQGMTASLLALKSSLSPTDYRVLAQRVELADSLLRGGRLSSALRSYREIGRDAARAGQPRVEGYARMRLAVIYAALVDAGSVEYRSSARAAVAWFDGTTGPDLEPFRIAARLLTARSAIDKGDLSAIDRLAARPAAEGGRPMLLFQPPVMPRAPGRAYNSGMSAGGQAMIDVDDQWADVSFRITPEGRVADVAVLRESVGLQRSWLDPYLAAIAGRRYTATADPSAPVLSRVERYTRTALWGALKGTRIRVRTDERRVVVLDLTDDVATPAGAR